MSARATPSSISAPHSNPRSGRGRQLTAREEELLQTICLKHARQELAFSKQPKSFWIACSEMFSGLACRSYSWQSCRRRMIAWEATQGPPNFDWKRRTDGPPASSASLLDANSSVSVDTRETQNDKDDCFPSIEVESEYDDDGLLPDAPIPPLQRYAHADCKTEQDALRDDMIFMFMSSVTAFEAQFRRFASVVLEDEVDRDLVTQGFDKFKYGLDCAVESVNSARR